MATPSGMCDLISLTRDETGVHRSGGLESSPPDHQRSPREGLFSPVFSVVCSEQEGTLVPSSSGITSLTIFKDRQKLNFISY